MKKNLFAAAGLTAIALFIISCNFTATAAGTNTFDKVKVNMTPEQVIEAMGEADSVTKIEIWQYKEGDTTIDISIQDGKVVNVRTFTIKSLKK